VLESAWQAHEAARKSRQQAAIEKIDSEHHEAEVRHEHRLREARRTSLEAAASAWGPEYVKADADAVLEAADEFGVQALFHATAADNLPTVLRHGILSLANLDAVGIVQKDIHGYGRIEKARSLSGHVATGIVPHLGMIQYMADPVILACDPTLLAKRGTFFVDRNTARSDVVLDEVVLRVSVADFQALFEGTPGSCRLRDWQSEVWVPERIEYDEILAVIVRSSAQAAHAQVILNTTPAESASMPQVMVRPSFFTALMWSPPELPGTRLDVSEEPPF
jgi:hypothetical protein